MKTSDARSSRSCCETAIERAVEVWWITCTTRPRNRSTKSSQACDWRARHRCKSWRSMSESATRFPFERLDEKPCGEAQNRTTPSANDVSANADRAKPRNLPYFTLTLAARQAQRKRGTITVASAVHVR